MTTLAEQLERLEERHKAALRTLPLPCPGNPARLEAARPYISLWRKSAKFWDEMLDLEQIGLVERRVSRGETLWRPTRPSGLAIIAALRAGEVSDEPI